MAALRVVRGSLSIDRLQRALRCLLSKHKILRTSLVFNSDDNTLKQCITDNHHAFTVTAERMFTTENELQDIIFHIITDASLFDLASGHVVHCQILRHQKSANENNDNGLITELDVVIIAVHHSAYDRSCTPIFFNDLCNIYKSDETWFENDESLQYIDYSVHERLLDRTASREFWYSQLKDYNVEHRLLLPVDRHRLSADQRSSSSSVAQITFDNNISAAFLDFASSHQVTLFQLGLAAFYTFLFKLTHGQTDLCISCLNANRYRTELQNMIGMFVSILPYRIHVNPQWSFEELVKHVREKCWSILEHAHYPLKDILTESHLNPSHVSFLETVFDFVITSSNIDQLSFDGASLEQVPMKHSYKVAKFDFMVIFAYDSTLDNDRLSCRLTASSDLFDETTVATMARRFQSLFIQLFSVKSKTDQIDQFTTVISKLRFMLPEEVDEMQEVVFRRLPNIVNEGMYVLLCLYLNTPSYSEQL